MNTIYCNFADLNYRQHQNFLIDHIKTNNMFDDAIGFTKEWLISTNFYKENKNILDRQRLCGYALWKPYIILETLKASNNDDIIIYMDCGDLPINNKINQHVKDYIQRHNEKYFLSGLTNTQGMYTKRDAFILMDCDEPRYWRDIQQEDGFIALKKSNSNIEFVEEWLYFCKNENILTDIPNTCGLPNLPEFIDHRHDQSVISLLKTKYSIPMNDSAREYIETNVLYHKDGESYSNGTARWNEMGEKI